MSDISPRRRRAARWLLGAGTAFALPLTATVVYAGRAEQVEPAAPMAPAAPTAPEAPAAPQPPKVVKRVVMIHDDADGEKGDALRETDAKFERRVERDGKTIILRSNREIDDAELESKLAKMETDLSALGDLKVLKGPGETMPRIIMRRHGGPGDASAAQAVAAKECAPGEGTQVEAKGQDGGQRRVVRIVTCGAGTHQDAALKAIRQARASIANDGAVSGAIREQVLKELDASIAEMEKGAD